MYDGGNDNDKPTTTQKRVLCDDETAFPLRPEPSHITRSNLVFRGKRTL